MDITQLQDRLAEIQEESEAILARAESEKRDLSDEERDELDALLEESETKSDDIARMQAIEDRRAKMNGSAGRKTTPEQPNTGADDDERPSMGRREPRINVRTDHSRWGWRSFGEFSMAVRNASVNGGSVDNRLAAQMAPTTYGSEGVGADGGWAVPPDFRASIMEKVLGESSLLSMTDRLTTSGNSITIPTDNTTPWQTTGGIQAYWDGEAQQLQQSKPALEQTELKLSKLTALCPVTEELLEDAPALDSYLRRKAPEKLDFKVNLAIVQGDGVGKPTGILNAPSLVSVAEESGQAADTVVAENVLKMYSRMYAPLRSGAVWLINQDIEPQLFTMSVPIKNVAGSENVGGSLVYMPAGGLSQSPFGTLFGRPVIPTQACETLGDKGDIIFVNLQQYLTATKGGGIRTDTSIHLYFDYAMTAYRFILRIAGQPWWGGTVSPRDGSNTLSWAVTLDARAG